MYTYDDIDQRMVDERVAQFRDQTRRFLAGQLTEDEFRPLRLRNGLYVQRHAPMLRVAVPYGLLSSTQLRMLGRIADKYDRGYGHFTTRQNIQYNWPKLGDVPVILDELASVEMHAVPLTLVAGLGHLWLGTVNFALVANLLLGSVPGIIAGSLLAGGLPDALVRRLLALVLLYAGGRLAFVSF